VRACDAAARGDRALPRTWRPDEDRQRGQRRAESPSTAATPLQSARRNAVTQAGSHQRPTWGDISLLRRSIPAVSPGLWLHPTTSANAKDLVRIEVSAFARAAGCLQHWARSLLAVIVCWQRSHPGASGRMLPWRRPVPARCPRPGCMPWLGSIRPCQPALAYKGDPRRVLDRFRRICEGCGVAACFLARRGSVWDDAGCGGTSTGVGRSGRCRAAAGRTGRAAAAGPACGRGSRRAGRARELTPCRGGVRDGAGPW
jgi:hypothetical protein